MSKRIPTTDVKAIQVFLCFKKSTRISGVQFNYRKQEFLDDFRNCIYIVNMFRIIIPERWFYWSLGRQNPICCKGCKSKSQTKTRHPGRRSEWRRTPMRLNSKNHILQHTSVDVASFLFILFHHCMIRSQILVSRCLRVMAGDCEECLDMSGTCI